MIRLYFAAAMIAVLLGIVCAIVANTIQVLALGLILIIFGAGGLSAGIMTFRA